MTFTSLMVKWQFSPYVFFIKDFKKNISTIDHSSIVNTEELTPETKNFKHHDFGSLINLKNTKISESIQIKCARGVGPALWLPHRKKNIRRS